MTGDQRAQEERPFSVALGGSPGSGSVRAGARRAYTSPRLTAHGAVGKSTTVMLDAVPSLPT